MNAGTIVKELRGRLLREHQSVSLPVLRRELTELLDSYDELRKSVEAALAIHGDGYSWGPSARAAIAKAESAS